MLNVVVKKEEGQHQEALKFFEKSPQVNAQEQQQQLQQQQLVSPTAVTEFPRLRVPGALRREAAPPRRAADRRD